MQMMSSPVATTAPAMEDMPAVKNIEFDWISTASGPVSISSTAGADSGFVTTPTTDQHYNDFVSYPQQHYPYETEVTTPSAWISTATSTASFDNSIQTTTGAVPVTELQKNHSCGSDHLDDACDHDHYDTHHSHHTEQAYEWYAPANQMPLAPISNNNYNNNNNCCPSITSYHTEAPTSAVTAAGPISTVPVSQPAAGTDDTDGDTPMEKKYQCQICGKYFRRDLPRHVRTHQEEGRFTCPFSRDQCPHKRGQFNRPYDFKKHLLHGHFTFDDQKRVRSFRNLRSKLSFPGMCVCGRRFVASDWLDNHVLGGYDRCPMLISVAADRLVRNRHVNENIDQF